MDNPIDGIFEALERIGGERYGDAGVSQLEHALQCALLAEQAGAGPELITAALLHDFGHVVDKHFEGAADRGVDRHHEDIGAGYLAKWFGDAVTEPIRLHVPAKRYLCAVDPSYWDQLSEASKQTLELQGGTFNDADVRDFETEPFWRQAADLRRWDDLAKVPGRTTPPLDHYRPIAEAAIKAAS
ncbi:MAG: HD domain-containing protein [Alphaproteobacteria bacterium]|nr:HD domain-containing protein [Alphaproteobacteria bacterium]